MEKILKEGSTFAVNCVSWEEYPFLMDTRVTVGYDEGGFSVRFVTDEPRIRATETEHNTFVHKDRCMEMFMQFAPESDIRYINIEANPNGAAYVSCSKKRGDSVMFEIEDINALNVKAVVTENGWELSYYLPAAIIQKYVPTYEHKTGAHLRGNFYKCGDLTDHEHYLSYAKIGTVEPDFHRPEYFADFILA